MAQSSDHSTETMWKCDLPTEAVEPRLIQQPDPWRCKQNQGNKDPQRFAFAIVCKHCDVARNSWEE